MKTLVNIVIDVVKFLNDSSSDQIDEDTAVSALEMISNQLQKCTQEERETLQVVLRKRASKSRGATRAFFEQFLTNAGIEDDFATSLKRTPSVPRKKPTPKSDKDVLIQQLGADFGSARIVRRVLDRSPALIRLDLGNKNLPIHFAAQLGHTEIVTLLIERGINPDIRDRDKYTPLHLALLNKHYDTLRVLVAAGANVNAPDFKGDKPLKLAREERCGRRIVKLLQKNGAKA